MSKNRTLLFMLAILFIVVPELKVRAQADSVSRTDTTINLSDDNTFLHFDQNQIRNLPFLNLSTFGLVSPSAYRLKGDRMFYFGVETGKDPTFIDGMQISDASDFPVRLIRSYQLFTGQAPLNMGFTQGGITSIETIRSPDEFTFLIDANTDLAYNMQGVQGELFLSIPLVSGKRRKEHRNVPSLLLDAKYVWTNNNDPVWKKTDKLKDDVLADLFANPLRPSGSGYGTYYNSEFVIEKDFAVLKVPDYNGRKGIFPFIKLELPVTGNTGLTLGNYSAIEEKDVFDFDNSVFNAQNNAVSTRRNFDTYLKWDQRFSVNENLDISYELLLQYSNHYNKTEDRQLGNNFFDYGYIGKFTTWKTSTYEVGDIVVDGTYYDNVWILNSRDYDTLVTYNPMGNNQGLTNYTSNYYDIYSGLPEGHYQNIDQIQLGGGLINGDSPHSVYGLWNNTATNSDYYQEKRFEKIRTAIQLKIDYKSQHFFLGGEYNRETRRQYSIAPTGLWTLMRGLTNFHIRELNRDNPIPVEHNGIVDTVIFYPNYQATAQRDFDKNLRKALGLPVDGVDFILTDSYDIKNNTINYYDREGVMHTIKTPENLFSLDLFSAEELLNEGSAFVSYAGYDYTGNREKRKTGPYSFYQDFTIDASRPEYWSVFFEDEFRWKKLHVRLGFRVDAYNANHPELNDLYTLFPAYSVSQALEQGIPGFTKPDNIGDDYVVYVDKIEDPDFVTGFRKDDQWFLSDGAETDDPTDLDAGGGVTPYLRYPDVARVGADGWSPDMTFRDYKTAFNFLPQITIDYSVTRRLNFYVNYSSSSQNPYYLSGFRPEVFYYWDNYTKDQIVPNPGLKPVATGKLFAGMKGLVWRNLVADLSYVMTSVKNYSQPKIMYGAYPKDYITLVNAKNKISTNGFLVRLDFVNPGLSGPFGGMSFTKLFPNESDPNFRQVSDAVFNTYVGYRFANESGSHRLSGFARAMSGFAASIYYQYRRGTPYFYFNPNNIKVVGHTPAVNLLNLNIQKDFILGEKAMMNVYLIVENPFNIKNVFKVYPQTGEADDDGFLSDPAYQDYINNQLNPDTYQLLYQMHLYDPENYDIPGIWRIGVIFKY